MQAAGQIETEKIDGQVMTDRQADRQKSIKTDK